MMFPSNKKPERHGQVSLTAFVPRRQNRQPWHPFRVGMMASALSNILTAWKVEMTKRG